MDLRLWCAGESSDPDACVGQCGCGYCTSIAESGACIGVPDFNLCRPMNLETFTDNCTKYMLPSEQVHDELQLVMLAALVLVGLIAGGVFVLMYKMYRAQRYEVYQATVEEESASATFGEFGDPQ